MAARPRFRAAVVSLFLLGALSAAHTHVCLADDIESPADILKRARHANVTDFEQPKRFAEFEKSVDVLKQSIAQLPPKEAAEHWLALVDSRGMSPNLESMMLPPFSKVFAALPTSAQWDALQSVVADRLKANPQLAVNQLLNLLAAVLRSDPDSIQHAIAAATSPQLVGRVDLPEILKQSTGKSEDPKDIPIDFEKDVDSDRQDNIEIPDLVTLVGNAQAETLLRKALLSQRQLSVTSGDATLALLRRLAVEMIDQLPRPHWELCDSIDALQLFEAMQKKFPGATTHPAENGGFLKRLFGRNQDAVAMDEYAYPRTEARRYYLLGLIAQNRIDDALVVAKQLTKDSSNYSYLPNEAMEKLDEAGLTSNVYNFLVREVSSEPGMPFWDELVQSAAKLGKTLTVLQIARDAEKQPGLSASDKRLVDKRLADALLAADQVDEGVAQLRACLGEFKDDPSTAIEIATHLATVGRITRQPALVTEGLDAATTSVRHAPPMQSYTLRGWFREERLAGRIPEIISALGDQLAAKTLDNSNRDPDLLAALAKAYYFANRPADVLAVFDTFPQWNMKDIIHSSTYESVSSDDPPCSFLIAWALASTGRKEDASRVLNYVLQTHGGFDPGYALLLTLNADPAPKLDALFALDRFEERPLIWKAIVLHHAGKLDEAEKVCRQAIAIDPSDGEEGKGDRMRAYSVLADVLSDKGDAKNAENFRQAVQAIRLAEDADDAWECNLLSRAVQMYRDALTHFENAYCIQSRLAVQLASLGRYDEAEAHYRKAYELMPESFGRVESHCFGCEGAFRGGKAQSIAEDVFTKLVASGPPIPQVHYLLGYLRTEQERWSEALKDFKDAVALDPDYLNAWKKIAECDEHAQLTQQEREDVALAILRLDPMCRHTEPNFAKFRDLPKLWHAADIATRQRPAIPTTLYPLAAATAAMKSNSGVGQIMNSENYDYANSVKKAATPGEMLMSVDRVKNIAVAIENMQMSN